MIDYDKMWDELSVILKKEYIASIQPHERTENQLKEAWNLSRSQVKLSIKDLIERGKLGSRIARSKNGRDIEVYFPIG